MSYFTLIKLIFFALLLCALASAPTLWYTLTQDNGEVAERYESFAFRSTIGNLGFKEDHCARAKMAASFLKFNCDFGQILSVDKWGVYELGSNEDDENACYMEENSCGDIGSADHALSKKLKSCVGETNCEIDPHEYLEFQETKSCPIQKTTTLFIQYQCGQMSPEEILWKRKMTLLIAAISIFIGFIIVNYSWYIQEYVDVETKLWDLQTRTAGDYTVEVPMTRQMLTNFYMSLTPHEKTLGAPLFQMKTKMMASLEEILRA